MHSLQGHFLQRPLLRPIRLALRLPNFARNFLHRPPALVEEGIPQRLLLGGHDDRRIDQMSTIVVPVTTAYSPKTTVAHHR